MSVKLKIYVCKKTREGFFSFPFPINIGHTEFKISSKHVQSNIYICMCVWKLMPPISPGLLR